MNTASSSSGILSSNRIHQTILNKDADSRIGPLRLADNSHAPIFENIARRAKQHPTVISKIQFLTGIGLGQTDAIPVRLPALLLPVLHVMENLAKIDLPVPRYTVYQATDFIAHTNGIPLERAREISSRMKQYLSRYIQTLHPSLVDSIELRFDCEHTDEIRSSISAIETDVRFDSAGILSSFESSEAKHSKNSGQALSYAAANVLYSGAYSDFYPFKDDLPEDVIALIPVGGKAEKPFFQITSSAAKTNATYSVLPLMTLLGSRPTYYAYPDRHDPLTAAQYGDALNGKLQDGPLRMDLQALIADGATPDLISQIYPSSL